MPSDVVCYDGSNDEEFVDYFLNLALERGKYGLCFIKNVTSDNCTPPDINDTDIDENSQLMFADLVKLLSPTVYKCLKQRKKTEFSTWRQTADVYALWTEVLNIKKDTVSQFVESAIVNKVRGNSRYNAFDGFKSMFSGDYIIASWAVNRIPEDLQSDIVDLNTNLGIIGALIITMAFPMFQSAEFDSNSWMSILYILLTGACGVIESASVLLCIRNIVVIQIVQPDNVAEYVTVANKFLIAPVKFNLVAIVCLMVALAIFSFWQYEALTSWIFIFGIILPSIVMFFISTASGIQCLYHVQPWDVSEVIKVDLKNNAGTASGNSGVKTNVVSVTAKQMNNKTVVPVNDNESKE